MAARENQGLQIALIIFVMLTIVLAVTTFIFFRQLDEEQTKYKQAAALQAGDAKTLRTAIQETTDLKQVIGAGPKDSVDAIKTNHKKDIDTFGPNFQEPERTYRHLIEHLTTQLRAVDATKEDFRSRQTTLENKIKTDEAAKAAEIAKYNEGLAKVTTDLETERAAFKQSRETLNTEKSALAKQFSDKREQADTDSKKIVVSLESMQKDYEKIVLRYERLKDLLDRETVSTETSDGKITWVNQANHVVWINLGADDGLKRQVTFKVVGYDETSPTKAVAKGSIEVVRLLDRHLSEARILDDKLSNPIMPGDQIFSDIFQAGRIEHFALAGFMDLDGDGESDRAKVKQLIAINGGIVDEEITDEGKREGEMTVGTQYLVLGERPTAEKATQQMLKAYTDILKEAKTVTVKQISLTQFSDYMGYRPQENTVAVGKRPLPGEKAQFSGSSERKSNAGIGVFRPRRPDPANRIKSPY